MVFDHSFNPRINLTVIGASKCGTTYFHDVLGQHPKVCMSSVKEPYLFMPESASASISQPAALFKHCRDALYFGESSPGYSETNVVPDVPKRLYRYNPHMKLVYLVREPFARLKSVFRQGMSTGHWANPELYGVYGRQMPVKFLDAIFEYPPLLDATRYWTHLQAFRKYFPDSSIKVILFEDLVQDPSASLSDVHKFLGLDVMIDISLHTARKNSGEAKKRYNPLWRELRSAIPSGVRSLLPRPARTLARKGLQRLSGSPVPDMHLCVKERERIKKELLPEILGIYNYLGINDDPWKFLD